MIREGTQTVDGIRLTALPAWKALAKHHVTITGQRTTEWFAEDLDRFQRFSLTCDGLLLDYSKQHITAETLSLLIRLAEESGLAEHIEALFTGKPVNMTEGRPVLHTALRASAAAQVRVGNHDILPDVLQGRQRMHDFSEAVRNGQWRGCTGKPVCDIVNLGIGGSDLGPRMALTALSASASKNLHCYFISDLDAGEIQRVLEKVDPERVLFIVSSKSFTTPETRQNTETVRQWLKEKLQRSDLAAHFVAVTAASERAKQQGFPETQIFPLWEWVGGRYSVWSAIGLPIAILLGWPAFEAFLAGAEAMDTHFRQTPFAGNLPVIMALLGIWNINFENSSAHVIAPYAGELRYFRDYIQQLDMESNGKRVNWFGETVSYATGPLILGEQGCDSQHSFFQLLHQGPQAIPVDFILLAEASGDCRHHDMQVASALSQAQALMKGKSAAIACDELMAKGWSEKNATWLAAHQTLPGNRPSSVLFLDRLTPDRLGKLIALYEHKIFVQGVIWQINSFDQWGVELGKQLMPAILSALETPAERYEMDSSTEGLLRYYQQWRGAGCD